MVRPGAAPAGMKLWLVRHAKPLIAPGICYGRLDVAADANATAECARRLAIELPTDIRVLASPLQRCQQLAQALQKLRPDLAFQADARLQEMDFGRWEGRAWDAIEPAELQAWTDDFSHYAVGHTGESVAAFMTRVAQAFDALGERVDSGNGWPALSPDRVPKDKAQDASAQAPASATLWITHAGVIRAVQLLALGLRQIEHARQWPMDAPKYGQWQTLDWPMEPVQAAQAASRSG